MTEIEIRNIKNNKKWTAYGNLTYSKGSGFFKVYYTSGQNRGQTKTYKTDTYRYTIKKN